MLKRYSTLLTIALAAAALAAAPFKDQQELIRVLKSDAPKADKAITCKFLAIVGDKQAVPALAPLLEDAELASWARIALESIPDPSADDALRYALDKVKGRLLIGVINSIGFRRSANAVDDLAPKLKNADPDVASAAAAALGKIGGERAATVLEQFLPAAPVAVRAAAAEGCILAAEQFATAGNAGRASKLYAAVISADVPEQRKLEATRGAILVQQSVPMLIEQFNGNEKAFLMAMRVARELKAPAVTDAMVAQLAKANPAAQALLINAMADRGDPKALPAVVAAALTGQTSVRIVAVRVLEKLGNVTCVPVLLQAAAADDAELSKAAMTSLTRMPGKDVDAAVFAQLKQSSGKTRQILIELAEQRRVDGALLAFVECAEDADAGVRSAAVIAIGAIGEEKQVADLAGLLQRAKDPKDREALEKALMSVCSRWTSSAPHLRPLLLSDQSANRITALRALACCGGTTAMASVKSALDDKDESVVDEAVRTLSTWPNRWPEDASVVEPLLTLVKSGRKPSHQVLAIRGYLQYVQGSKQLSATDKLAKVDGILPLITRPEERRTAISALGAIGGAGSLQRLVVLANDPAVAEEACSAIVNLLGKNVPGVNRDQRRAALQAVVEKSKAEATKKKAEELLKTTR